MVTGTARKRGGVILAHALARKKIAKVFTLCGGFINPVLEGLHDVEIPVINTPHEQVAGHMADAWTRITNEPAVCLVGPEGFANAVPAMLEAFGNRSPVLFITGSSTLKRRGANGFKEVDDVRIAAPITKASSLVTDGRRIPEFIDRAYQACIAGEPGPVHLSVPVDLLYSTYDDDEVWRERPFDHAPKPPQRCAPDAGALRALTDLLGGAARPLFIVGRGVSWANARAALSELANRHRIPVLNAPYHPKVLSNDDPPFLGLADVHLYTPANFALQECDLAVIVGCRLDNMLNFGNPPFFRPDLTVVTVNGSPSECIENHAAELQVLGDPKLVLEALIKALASAKKKSNGRWLENNIAQRDVWLRGMRDYLANDERRDHERGIHPLRLSWSLLEALNRNDWFIIDGGDTHFWAEIALNLARKPLCGILQPGPYSLLGPGVAFATTAKLRHPGARVVLLSGDGAFLNGGLSIEVAFEEGLPITVVIDNNNGLGSISQQQVRLFGTEFKTRFRDIPFHKLFEGLGGGGEVVENHDELVPALRRALQSGKPYCLNVRTRSVASPLVEALLDRRAKSSIE